MRSGRAPFGNMGTRHPSARFTTNLPNVAARGYGVLQFETSFTSAPGMIETVTPMLDKDGKWKVLGYFVKRGRLALRQPGRTEGADLISTS
ncbi:MAG TPA: DUF4019 domain-containing protein [Terriglobales bacterium]